MHSRAGYTRPSRAATGKERNTTTQGAKKMTDRRDFLKSTGAAAFTTSLFTGKVRGANDKVAAAFIGMGKMGRANLRIAMRQENLVPVAVCDVFQRNLDWAVRDSKNQAKPYRDFREVLADKSIDVVCISTPDHW